MIFPGKHSYCGLALLGAVDLLWIGLAGHSVDISTILPAMTGIIISFVLLLSVMWIARARLDGKALSGIAVKVPGALLERLEVLLGSTVFLLLGWIVLRVFNHLSMTVPVPYADGVLASMDQALLLDWNAYFNFVAASPFLISSLDILYTGLTPITVIAFYLLVIGNEQEKARYFTITFVITALVCTVIGILFPARAAVAHLLEDTTLLQNFPFPPGTYSVDILERLRSGTQQVFAIDNLPGLTTFPSFHTAAGIVLVYAFRKTFLFVPMCLYTSAMIASTPIYGGHYFVDLMAGTAVAVLVCRFVERKWFSGVFGPVLEAENRHDREKVGAVIAAE